MSTSPAKPLVKKYIQTTLSQPMDVYTYIMQCNSLFSTVLLMKMFARLLVILASRKYLHAAELVYITSGRYLPELQYADWSPEDEIEEGLQPQIIRGI